jgi:hypothetical protein
MVCRLSWSAALIVLGKRGGIRLPHPKRPPLAVSVVLIPVPEKEAMAIWQEVARLLVGESPCSV